MQSKNAIAIVHAMASMRGMHQLYIYIYIFLTQMLDAGSSIEKCYFQCEHGGRAIALFTTNKQDTIP